MKKTLRTAFAATVVLVGLCGPDSAQAQDAILAEMYGRGVHAYYAGNYSDASQYLSMAIDNGIKDPRAYYFRGIVAQASGRPYEAETDWQLGAAMEAAGRSNPAIGRSLARFQGSARLKLETIRQQERLKALANKQSRSKARYGELGIDPGAPPAPTPVPGAAPPAAPVAPPSPPAAEDPFADDMAQGDASVQADDALEGAMDPVAGEEPASGAAPAAGDDNPFGPDAGGAADPFGGGGDADPFGGGGDAGGDPFGGDAGEDPFGGGDDPFGS